MTITRLARDALPFYHFFDHGIIGSGTAILCKVPVVDAAFHEFSLNGYPHKILHGDWFAGKGIGVCNIDFKGININVFVSHFHAEYDRSNDIYVGHRVMQALEAAQWIKLTSAGADLTIYAGDFNTEPVDTPYKLLRTVARLRDSWLEVHDSEVGGQTCDTGYNSYSSDPGGLGKRIDYIMYRPGKGASHVKTVSSQLPLNRRIPASMSATLGREVSYSDHEAVHSVLEISQGGSGDSSDAKNMNSSNNSNHRRETIDKAIELIERAQEKTSFDQAFYSVLFLIITLAFIGTFSQLLDLDRYNKFWYDQNLSIKSTHLSAFSSSVVCLW